MSGYVVSRYVLVCDRCGTKFGEAGEYTSSMDAHAAAYNLGWRYPHRTNAQGKPSIRTDDVCPGCGGKE